MKKIASQTTATLTRNGTFALASAIASGLPAARLPRTRNTTSTAAKPAATYPSDSAVKPCEETR